MRRTFERARLIAVVLFLSILCMQLVGCGNRFFDPAQIGRFRPTPAVNVILDSLGVAEETSVPWQRAEDPRPGDVVAVKSDYVFGAGDVVRISIFELYQEGVTFAQDYVVTETGKLSIPDVGVVQAVGLTERQLEEEIEQIVSPGLLKNPSVSVTLISSQQRTFSILGAGVPRSNRYIIPRYDFRLFDALAMAGGPSQFNVSYIYVTRHKETDQGPASLTEIKAGQSGIERLDVVQPAQSRAGTFMPQRSGTEWPTNAGPSLAVIDGSARQSSQQIYQPQQRMLYGTSRQVQSQWPESEKVVISPSEMARPGEFYNQAVPGMLNQSNNYMRAGIYQNNQPSLTSDGQSNWPVTSGASGAGLLNAPLAPMASSGTAGGGAVQENSREKLEWIFRDGRWVLVPVEAPKPAQPEIKSDTRAEAEVEWIFRDGQWIPVPVGGTRPTEPVVITKPQEPLESKLAQELQWEAQIQGRVIRIPTEKLLAGDPKYNIVIKPGDTIHVPVDIIGECWIMGNVNYRGPINLSGRPMTLKMAIAAAGGLGPLAWPKYCEVIRRIGQDREEIVMVDLDKISRGEQPDFFIKPNDLINVGTHATSRWRAVLRNSFRATYGFGFVYDRNFADADYGKGFRLPGWF